MGPRSSDALDIVLDRDAEVPIGVQLAWALRARIVGGTLAAGQRLPGLHRLAADLGVNANTVRTVYARLEQDGLVETRHGAGTFVTGAPGGGALAQLASGAARAARDAGLDPRELAAALYVGAEDTGAPDAAAAERRRLRAQIAALEQALADLLRHRPDLLPPAPRAAMRPAEARLPSAAELQAQRDELLRRLAGAQHAADAAPEPEPAPAPRRTARAGAGAGAASERAAQPKLRPRTT